MTTATSRSSSARRGGRGTSIATTVAVLALGVYARGGDPFVDVTAGVGLGDYRASTGDGHGPGAVFTDLDADGYPELYLVRSAPNQLYLNRADGNGGRTYALLRDGHGADHPGRATGAIAGDYDNDGDLDLYVINFDQANALLQSQWAQTGSLIFEDVTLATDPTPGIEDGQFGVGIAFFEGVPLDNSLTAGWSDVDRDGDLDLYVGNHNGWYNNNIEGPFDVPGRRDVFYLNNGDGTFVDVTMEYGVTGYLSAEGEVQTENQRFSSTNAVIFADFDNDRWPDLLVTNKIGGPDDRDMLYLNRGAGEAGTWLGFELVTYDLEPTFGHRSGAAMGVDVGDPDNDGDLDIYITDWSNPDLPEAPGQNDLWVNLHAQTGALSFVHSGDLPAKFSWGTQWQDFELNGLQDLHVATQGNFPDFLYLNAGGVFLEAAETLGVAQSRNARTSVSADYDRNGWPDLLVVNLDGGPSVLYANNLGAYFPENHFLVVQLHGDATGDGSLRSTRDAIGARATVFADLDGDGAIAPHERQMREVVSGSSNAASTASLALEFGLAQGVVAILAIDWPSGRQSSFFSRPDRFVAIDEGDLTPGDLDADGAVDTADIILLLGTWGDCPEDAMPCPADFDGSGRVDVADLLVVLANWT